MDIRHMVEEGVLHVALLHDLDVTSRAAASLELEMLLFTHRPHHVRIQLPTSDPSPASVSVLARARRMCEGLGIPLTVVGPAAPHPPRSPAAA
ncbi:hypothetical protein [Streptomyces gardneri]|uniref:STAS domain-containing protein n=1 Tax=Streptomyces gardneri TaxID=66892 RepID=A0A4Y3RXH7_9ACTN|nr:hypothetical protein [Streptomyces gardneri]GEB62115.1 hypothetical protein SGA01_77200 [Streptomyces gardneri]GHH23429.1 hypothetical protein GCM10017674_80000 [Streptomyces gardneri]